MLPWPRCIMAFRANPANLDDCVLHMKTARLGRSANGTERVRRVDFGYALAIFAKKGDRLRHRRMIGHTGKKGVAAFEAVNEASALQHLQNAIDRNRSQTLTLFCEAIDQIVSAYGLMACCDMAKDLLAEGRPFDAQVEASGFRAPKRVVHADTMIVIAGWE